jgi:hypothetical protein
MLTGIVTAGMLIGGGAAANATASQIVSSPIAMRTTHSQAPQHISNLTYGGAKVQVKNTNYVILWEPPKLQDGTASFVSPMYNSLISRYFTDVGGNGLYNNNTQYYQIINGTKKNIKNISTLGGVYLDTTAYPKNHCNDPNTGANCVNDQDMRDAVARARQANGWKATPKDMFFVFTVKNEGSCAVLDIGNLGCSFSNWCGYHYFSGKMMYANMPYANTFAGNCTTRTSFPNDPDADVTLSVASHEQMEAVTDGYYPNGWNSPSGEIGDLCAYNYGTVGLDGGKANEQWNGNFYILQQEWSNKQSKCVQTGP